MTLLASPVETASAKGSEYTRLAESAGCSVACRTWWCADDPAHPDWTLLHHHRETEPHRLPVGALDPASVATAVEWLRSFHS